MRAHTDSRRKPCVSQRESCSWPRFGISSRVRANDGRNDWFLCDRVAAAVRCIHRSLSVFCSGVEHGGGHPPSPLRSGRWASQRRARPGVRPQHRYPCARDTADACRQASPAGLTGRGGHLRIRALLTLSTCRDPRSPPSPPSLDKKLNAVPSTRAALARRPACYPRVPPGQVRSESPDMSRYTETETASHHDAVIAAPGFGRTSVQDGCEAGILGWSSLNSPSAPALVSPDDDDWTI